jgi:hypothetical protein
VQCRRAELSIGGGWAVGLCDDPGLDALAAVRSLSARSRSINGIERSERRRVAIRALQPHRRNARFAAGLPPIEKPPTNRSFWFVLLLIVAVSLSAKDCSENGECWQDERHEHVRWKAADLRVSMVGWCCI